jgi:hypothetical protein
MKFTEITSGREESDHKIVSCIFVEDYRLLAHDTVLYGKYLQTIRKTALSAFSERATLREEWRLLGY